MPSPFPGMDPFIEGSEDWGDFHGRLHYAIADALIPLVRPAYVIRAKRRVCSECSPDVIRESFLEIRTRDGHELVTAIEVLSPTNKRPNSDGRREYLEKCDELLQRAVHIVEIDLLRGGARMPGGNAVPAEEYCVLVSRSARRPVAEVWPARLRLPLPTVPIPLAGSDPDVPLDVQACFTEAYDRGGYDYSLDYGRPLAPPPEPETQAWIDGVIAER